MEAQLSQEQFPAPVYDGYFADPCVWQFDGQYFAIGTGPAEAAGETARAAKVFPLLHSRDFIHWGYAAQALERPEGGNEKIPND